MKTKSLLYAMRPKKGHKFTIPCKFKLTGFYYLSKIKETADHKKVDLNDKKFAIKCNHDLQEDDEEQHQL